MWPSNAVPEHVIDKVFERMSAIYGQRFIDMWHNVDPATFRETWARGLKRVRPLDLKRGLAALLRTKYPPTLPEFLELCRPTPQQFVAHSMLTDQSTIKMTPTGFEQLRVIKAIVDDSFEKARPDGIEWARRLLANAKEGHEISAIQIEFAEDAIRRWEMTHHQAERDDEQPDELPPRVPSPHIYGDREPGSDDEELAS
ncbi:hypothetical protein P9281_27565 [Caballeronia sp. LP003]|uniref:hypothetical protein n=1 Tax=Caballeronia sp. LP003 TaxID=3038551 RepID=UPI00285ADE7B|nr:hypothetical protein [Caballeronia sp. LP003]MDR5790309.1 hypothetical protein [Caballeronia sp. LP003]